MLPGRPHLDLLEIPRLLPYRLIGTAVVEKVSLDVTGACVEDVHPEDAAQAIMAAL